MRESHNKWLLSPILPLFYPMLERGEEIQNCLENDGDEET